jgi:hypothetical protein
MCFKCLLSRLEMYLGGKGEMFSDSYTYTTMFHCWSILLVEKHGVPEITTGLPIEITIS